MSIENKLIQLNNQYQNEFADKDGANIPTDSAIALKAYVNSINTQLTSLINTINNTLNSMDYVIDTKRDTSDNSNIRWYRLYKSGWLIQGGSCKQTSGSERGSRAITFLLPFSDNLYSVGSTYDSGSGTNTTGYYSYTASRTTTGMTLSTYSGRHTSYICMGYKGA